MEKAEDIKPYFSIITCAYNPDKEILKKCLTAVNDLNYPKTGYEIILVNNNPPHAGASLLGPLNIHAGNLAEVREYKAGLTNARLKGVEKSKGQWIVFFDDDNQPDSEYLNNLKELVRKYPAVAVWGPGNIYVKFIGEVPGYMHGLKGWYQEKHIEREIYGNSPYFTNYYPAGTGMAVRRDVITAYSRLIREGKLNAGDRTAGKLSSGGDTQIVYTATKSGHSVGIAPGLRLNHLISCEKANIGYLKKMIYGVYNTGLVHKEANPALAGQLKIPTRAGFYYLLAKKIVAHRFRIWSPHFITEIARYAGTLQSIFDIHEKKAFFELRFLKRVYGLG